MTYRYAKIEELDQGYVVETYCAYGSKRKAAKNLEEAEKIAHDYLAPFWEEEKCNTQNSVDQ